jgi:flagellar hook-associated protein 3 FlgL
MRITQSQLAQQAVFDIGQALSRLTEYRLQLSSQRRINSFADDPRGVGAAQRYRILTSSNDQYLRNASSATTFLDATDSALQQMADAVSGLRELVLRQTGPVANDQTRSAAAGEAAQLRDQVLAIVNQTVEGGYLFGGFRTRNAPFVLQGGQVTYAGDDGVQMVQIGPTLRVMANLPGSALLGSDHAALSGSVDLRPRLAGTTLLTSMGGGAGFSGGSLHVTDGLGAGADINLSGAATVQDVLDAFNGSGLAVTARISDDETGITLEGSGSLTVAEVAGGSAAQQLGLLGTTSSGALVGRDVRAALTLATPWAQMRALDGKSLGTLRIIIGGVATDVDLSAAANLGDARNAIRALNPDMDLQIDRGAVRLVYAQAKPFQVSSPSGDTTADALGVVGNATPTRLFGAFADVIAALQSGDVSALRQTLAEIEDVHAGLLRQDVSIGAHQNLVANAGQLLRARNESLQLRRSSIEDADLVDAATNASFAEAAYQAALAASSRIFNLSLASYL